MKAVPRAVWIVAGVVVLLLVVAIIVLVSILNELNAQEAQRAYELCMARYGFAADQPTGNVDDTDAYLDGLLAAAEACGR